jgi:hypothetical protein
MDVSLPWNALAQDHVSRQCVSVATKIAAQLRQSNQEVSYSSALSIVLHWFEMFEHFNPDF